MVERRIFAFATLVTLVWAILASSYAAYLYLQNANYMKLQDSVNEMGSAYNHLIDKYNNLGSDYSKLYGNYVFPSGVNFTSQIEQLETMVNNLGINYSSTLASTKDLNETYYALRSDLKESNKNGNETIEDFGLLLDKFYELLNLLTLRELSGIVSKTITLVVSIGIEYKNGTVEWHNQTEMPAGSSLLQLTQEIATINYTYYQWSKPGHVLINSVNDQKAEVKPDFSEGWNWIWYQWDTSRQKWVSGVVGSDGWMLEDGGTYKWRFEHWHWP